VTRVADAWLARHRDSRFFLLLHYMDPHDPYFPHPYTGEGIARVEADNPDPSQAAHMRELYDGEIRFTDEHVGMVEAKLRELGIWDDTMIVITADHGEEFQEHGGWWHGTTLYEEQIHVPLLVKWPKSEVGAPARVTDHPVRHIDVAPTLLTLAGAPSPAGMQGKDLAVPMAKRSESERMHYAEEDHEGNVLHAIRTNTWKLIEANAGNPRGLPTEELFAIGRIRRRSRTWWSRTRRSPRRCGGTPKRSASSQRVRRSKPASRRSSPRKSARSCACSGTCRTATR
jgi:arylsulfatase A-like enzyme